MNMQPKINGKIMNHSIPDEEDFFIAVHLSHIQTLRSILKKDFEMVNYQEKEKGNQPIHIAANENNFQVARLLIEFDARIGRRNYDGLTPLGIARMNGNSDFVNLLNLHYIVDEDSGRQEEPEAVLYKRVNLDSIPSQAAIREEDRQKR